MTSVISHFIPWPSTEPSCHSFYYAVWFAISFFSNSFQFVYFLFQLCYIGLFDLQWKIWNTVTSLLCETWWFEHICKIWRTWPTTCIMKTFDVVLWPVSESMENRRAFQTSTNLSLIVAIQSNHSICITANHLSLSFVQQISFPTKSKDEIKIYQLISAGIKGKGNVDEIKKDSLCMQTERGNRNSIGLCIDWCSRL